jgi:hypothetical protein
MKKKSQDQQSFLRNAGDRGVPEPKVLCTRGQCVPYVTLDTSIAMSNNDLIRGVVEGSAGEWFVILSMVFGGCCS